jgi:hypothetical protein
MLPSPSPSATVESRRERFSGEKGFEVPLPKLEEGFKVRAQAVCREFRLLLKTIIMRKF